MDPLAARPFVSRPGTGCSPAAFARHPPRISAPCPGGFLRRGTRLVRANATRPPRAAASPPAGHSPASACSGNRAQDDLPGTGRAILGAVSGLNVSWTIVSKGLNQEHPVTANVAL